MQVGDKIMHKPFVLRYSSSDPRFESRTRAVPCRVVWIHPSGRFAVVERDNGLYSYRECVWCDENNRNEVKRRENNSNYEPEGRRGKNRNCPHFGRRAAPRREDFCAG